MILALLASIDTIPEPLVLSCVCKFRDRGAGVIRSCGACLSRLISLLGIGLFLRVVAAPPLRRTIRGLADRFGADESPIALFVAMRAGEVGLKGGIGSPRNARSVRAPFRCEGDEPITDASSPSIAFASALNFIGGTGISSSELSPIENFQASGRGPLLAVRTRERGEPRFMFGLEGFVRTVCRDRGRRAKLS